MVCCCRVWPYQCDAGRILSSGMAAEVGTSEATVSHQWWDEILVNSYRNREISASSKTQQAGGGEVWALVLALEFMAGLKNLLVGALRQTIKVFPLVVVKSRTGTVHSHSWVLAYGWGALVEGVLLHLAGPREQIHWKPQQTEHIVLLAGSPPPPAQIWQPD